MGVPRNRAAVEAEVVVVAGNCGGCGDDGDRTAVEKTMP